MRKRTLKDKAGRWLTQANAKRQVELILQLIESEDLDDYNLGRQLFNFCLWDSTPQGHQPWGDLANKLQHHGIKIRRPELRLELAIMVVEVRDWLKGRKNA